MQLRSIAVPGLFLLCAVILATASASPWTSSLQRGGEIQVDPDTRRPIMIENGSETQLWDGVHRLDDGSTITVRGGRVVPTEGMLAAPDTPPEPTGHMEGEDALTPPVGPEPAPAPTFDGVSACERLVIDVCGADRRCWSAPACVAARQLRDLEREERIRGADPDALRATASQCEAAAASAFFVPCP